MRSALSLHGRALGGAALLVLALVVGARFVLHLGTAAPAPAPAAARAQRLVALRGGQVGAAPVEQLLVHVVGAVRRPGLYRLPRGARVNDAVSRAGGATRAADLALVNLAAPVADGTQVAVPARGAARAPAGAGGPAAPQGPLPLNAASVEQLDALPGIGPVTAQRIVAYREAHGLFRSLEELDAIPGIGPARIEQLRDLVTV